MSKAIKKIKPETKVCKKCGRELPLDRFAHNYKTYYHPVCLFRMCKPDQRNGGDKEI